MSRDGIDRIVKRWGWSRLAYEPRGNMPVRIRQLFNEKYNTAEIAAIFGYKESAIERWLHLTSGRK
jgi:hypothetical protein